MSIGRVQTKAARRRGNSRPLRELDAETGWLRRGVFLAGLQEQVSLARKGGWELTLISCELPLSVWDEASGPRVQVAVRLGLLAREAVLEGVSFGRISEDEFAVCLPRTEDPWRAAIAALIEDRLAAITGPGSVAAFSITPSEQLESAAILDAARAALDRRSLGNMVYLDDYRHRRGPHAA